MSREWTVVIKGDWYLPHFVNMLQEYRGNGEQVSCATEVIEQIQSQMIPLEGDETLKTTRPLVVIDPEDGEAVERLLTLLRSQDRAPETADIMRAALREYANPKPPRPDEPQGLYARVEDADGRIWVRTALQASVWRRESVNSGGFRYLIPQDGCEDYDRIAVVRVLSPGVEVDQ